MKIRFREPYRNRQINFRGHLFDIPSHGEMVVGDEIGREICLSLFAFKLPEPKPILVSLEEKVSDKKQEEEISEEKPKRKGRKFE